MKMLDAFAILLLVSYTTLGDARSLESVDSRAYSKARSLKIEATHSVWQDCPANVTASSLLLDCAVPLKFDKGIKRKGVVKYTATTSSKYACADECNTHADCAAVNFNKKSGQCNMISSLEGAEKTDNFTKSALIKAECKNICYEGNIISGYHRSGHDTYAFETKVVKSHKECCEICAVTAICTSWDYGHAHTRCYMKTGIPKLVEGDHNC